MVHMANKTVSLHVRLSESDYLALGYEAVRRRTGKASLLLSLAGPALAKLRREEQARYLPIGAEMPAPAFITKMIPIEGPASDEQ